MKTDADVTTTRKAIAAVIGRHPLMDETAVAVASVERGSDAGLRSLVDPYGARRQDGDEDGIARDVAELRDAITSAPADELAVLVDLGPLAHRAGRQCDPATIKTQVGPWTWMGMGAKTVIGHPDALQVDVHLGAGHTKRRLLIKLMPSDTYSLELGRVRSRGLDFDVIEHVHDVYAEDLDRQVRDLYDRHAV